MSSSLVISEELKKGRRKIVQFIYKDLVGRNISSKELNYYVNGEESLEHIYLNIKASNYEEVLEKENKLPLSLVVFCKNNEDSIEICINSVISIVSEIVIVDTGSSDRTIEKCRKYTDRIYKVGFTDFGSIRTLTAHLANQEWVLGLDSDEIINKNELRLIEGLISDNKVDLWGLPRRRWSDLNMTQQVELEAYPDWQYRLFKNNKKIYYSGRVHESAEGSTIKKESPSGPHIEHFQDVFKTGEGLKNRNDMYKKFYALDTTDGIKHGCPAVSSIDEDK